MVSELVLLRPAWMPANEGFYVEDGEVRKKESLISDLKDFISRRFNFPHPQVTVGEDGHVTITGLYDALPDYTDYNHEVFDHILDLVGWIEGRVELPISSESVAHKVFEEMPPVVTSEIDEFLKLDGMRNNENTVIDQNPICKVLKSDEIVIQGEERAQAKLKDGPNVSKDLADLVVHQVLEQLPKSTNDDETESIEPEPPDLVGSGNLKMGRAMIVNEPPTHDEIRTTKLVSMEETSDLDARQLLDELPKSVSINDSDLIEKEGLERVESMVAKGFPRPFVYRMLDDTLEPHQDLKRVGSQAIESAQQLFDEMPKLQSCHGLQVLTHLWKVEKALGRERNYAPAVSKDEVQKLERCLVLPSVTELQRETPITLVRSGIYTPPLVNFDHWMLELGCMGKFAFDPRGLAAALAPYATYLLPRGFMDISIDKSEFYLGDCVASIDNTATLSYELGLNIHHEETESLADVNESVEMVFDPGGVHLVCAHCATLVLSGISADFCCHFGTDSELGQAKAKLMFQKLSLGSKPVMIDYYAECFACSTSRTMRVARDKAESGMFDPGGKCSAPIDILSNNIKATFNPLLVKPIKSNEHWLVLLGINSEPLMIFLIGICSILYAENGTLGICSAGTCLLKPQELTNVNKIGEMVTFDPGKIAEFMFGDINLSSATADLKFHPESVDSNECFKEKIQLKISKEAKENWPYSIIIIALLSKGLGSYRVHMPNSFGKYVDLVLLALRDITCSCRHGCICYYGEHAKMTVTDEVSDVSNEIISTLEVCKSGTCIPPAETSLLRVNALSNEDKNGEIMILDNREEASLYAIRTIKMCEGYAYEIEWKYEVEEKVEHDLKRFKNACGSISRAGAQWRFEYENGIKNQWLPNCSQLKSALDSFGFLVHLHAHPLFDKELNGEGSSNQRPSCNVRTWIKFMIACYQQLVFDPGGKWPIQREMLTVCITWMLPLLVVKTATSSLEALFCLVKTNIVILVFDPGGEFLRLTSKVQRRCDLSLSSCFAISKEHCSMILEDKDPLKKGVLMQDYGLPSDLMLVCILVEPGLSGLFISFTEPGLSRFRVYLPCT